MHKVIILASDLSGLGGTETVFRIVLDNIPETQIVITTPMKNSNWLSGISSNRIKNIGFKNRFFRIIRLMLYLLGLSDETLLINKPSRIFFADIIKKFFHKKYKIVSWVHFSLDAKNSVDAKQLKYLIRADMNLAISSAIYSQLIDIGIDEKKIKLIYNPAILSTKLIEPSSGKAKIVYIGRVQYRKQKNLALLFNALAMLDPNSWTLDVYGQGDNSETAKCIQLLKKLNIEQNVIWHGWVENIWENIEECDFLTLSSSYEGFPMTLIEAMSHGIPCISTDCPTGPSDIINSSNGILVPVNNAQTYANAMKKIINKDVNFDRKVIVASVKQFGVQKYLMRLKRALRIQ